MPRRPISRFSGPWHLQIFRLDFSSPDHDLKLAGGAVQAPERFSRVCWGPPGADAKTYPVRCWLGDGGGWW